MEVWRLGLKVGHLSALFLSLTGCFKYTRTRYYRRNSIIDIFRKYFNLH